MISDDERFRLVARAAVDAMWDWDLRTDRLWWSEGFENLFGFSAENAEHDFSGWAARVHPEDRDRVVNGIRAAAERSPGWADSYRFRGKNGGYVYVLDRGYVLREPDGTPVRMIGGMTDITQRQAVAEMLDEVNQQLRALSAQVIRAQEDERARIARELHDELGQILTVAKMRLGMAKGVEPERAQEMVQAAIRDIDNGIAAVRRMSLDLHPPQLQLGLESAVTALLHWDIPEDGPEFELHSDIGDLKLDPASAITAFRVVQESLSNALRHAGAQRIEVRLHSDERWLHVEVSDDGVGFDPALARRKSLEGRATGLLGLRERCLNLGGNLRVSSAPGVGCEILAELPLRSGGV